MTHSEAIIKELKSRQDMLLDPPKHDRLMEVTGLTSFFLYQTLKEMETGGLIDRRGHGDRNVYLKEAS